MEKSKKVETIKDWKQLYKMLANPNCSKCYGRGFTGMKIGNTGVDKNGNIIEKEKVIGCTAKGCAESKLYQIQRKQYIEKMKKKQNKVKEKVNVPKVLDGYIQTKEDK